MATRNPIRSVVDTGRAESNAAHPGPKWVHFVTFVALGTSVLYFTIQLDKVLSHKVGRVGRAVRG